MTSLDPPVAPPIASTLPSVRPPESLPFPPLRESTTPPIAVSLSEHAGVLA
jgi:hypothetical protein